MDGFQIKALNDGAIDEYYPENPTEMNNFIATKTGVNAQIISSKKQNEFLFDPRRVAGNNTKPLIIDKNDDDKLYYISVIHNETNRMNRLVKNLLNLSRYRYKRFRIRFNNYKKISYSPWC